MPKVALGTKVPDFSLPATGGGTFTLSETAGRLRVIYFYPKDMTSGCTRESQDFRDLHPAFRRAGAEIVGISRDSLASHEKFKAKEQLPFELLADVDERVCKLFDVIRGKTLYGRKFLGIERSTFLIDGQGVLRQEWRKIKVPEHAQAVLTAVRAL